MYEICIETSSVGLYHHHVAEIIWNFDASMKQFQMNKKNIFMHENAVPQQSKSVEIFCLATTNPVGKFWLQRHLPW